MTRPLPQIPCPKCHGKGTAALSPKLAVTLIAVRTMKQATAKGVFDTIISKGSPLGVTAFNRRLEMLVELGVLKRERKWRDVVYSENK